MGHEYRRAPGQLAKFASMKIICQHSCFSFIAPSLAATGFGAIILRSSLTGLRMTAGRPMPEPGMRMMLTLHIYRCYDQVVERWKGEMVERFRDF
jgi:hypothetical protein